jgi:hypothetical protein
MLDLHRVSHLRLGEEYLKQRLSEAIVNANSVKNNKALELDSKVAHILEIELAKGMLFGKCQLCKY